MLLGSVSAATRACKKLWFRALRYGVEACYVECAGHGVQFLQEMCFKDLLKNSGF